MHQMKDICHQYDTENHCGYLISLDLAKSPFVKVPDLVKTKVLDLSP